MATATATLSTVHLTSISPAIIRVPTISQSSVEKITSLLQRNHENHYITLMKLANTSKSSTIISPPSVLAPTQKPYRTSTTNAEYQRLPPPVDEDTVSRLREAEDFKARAGNPNNFTNFLTLFSRRLSNLVSARHPERIRLLA
ncbi:hypothetical protein G647_05765 [Cladophialophora carrionii CBS 160.54]|uniref:Uncharacterized protein n=1 Tax=Cladophialophora carrionii CBS 160.54 TaxID=1279043 RepID=V9DCD0_9EURO|nr:uncharacterized protein G647_05765 [Cladophialophora carrionii CBS 160.54]ETI23958.1 hypothetical protein G647_05765 [Cladophialophora carrionii CBS 160.54]